MFLPPRNDALKVAVWGINYAPELTGIGPYNRALCEYFAARGHEVEVFTTFPYYPAWEKCPADRGKIYRREILSGVTVHRCWHWVPKPGRAWKRILHEFSFVAHTALRLLFSRKFDILIVVSPPLLLGAAVATICFLRGEKYVFHVQDLQPDAARTLQMLKPGLFMKILYWLEKVAYSRAWKISGIGTAMLRAMEKKGHPVNKLILFPNGVVLPEKRKAPYPGTFRQKHGIGPEEILAVYSGNVGYKQGLPVLIATARLLGSQPVRIVIAGDGAYRTILDAILREKPCDRILMLPIQPEQDYEDMLLDADICAIPQISGTGALFLPSKLLKILALGKPVVATCDPESALAQAITEGNFGKILPAESHESLREFLENLSTRKADLAAWGENGRRYVERYEMTRTLQEFEKVLLTAKA